MNRFFITTPIYYPNARPHLGSAYTTIVCDVMARYKRMCGYDVAFLTGTDEHGEKLQRAADAAGIPVERFVAEKRELFKSLWRTLGIPEYSPEHPAGYRFVHTSQNPDHVESVHWMIRQAQKAGYIAKKKYEGRYCIHDERYVSDSTEPANCDICGRPAELISEENYFFRLSAFQDRLLKLYQDHPEFVLPDFRMNEVKSFVKSGLRDISISRRRLKWGVPWPDDAEQVVYVWYDALTSYLTGIGFRGLDATDPNSDFYKYWMDPSAERVHMIGKDILRFHAVYWPAFLMAANEALPEGDRLPLPTTIFAHGWIYYEQDKMSKSKGNVVYPEPIVEALNSFGAPGNDALRYYLLRDTPFGQDASFSYEGLIQRYNSDLANGLGNLAKRTLDMVAKYCSGVVPDASEMNLRTGGTWFSLQADTSRARYADQVSSAYASFQISTALELIWTFVIFYGGRSSPAVESVDADGFLSIYQPWAEAGDPTQRWLVDGVLYVTLEAVRAAAAFAHAVIPEATRRVWAQLGAERYLGNVEDQRFTDWRWRGLKPGSKVGKPEPIFPRLDKEKTLAKLHELAEADRVRERAVAPAYDRRPADKSPTKGATVEQQPEQKPPSAEPLASRGTGFQPVEQPTRNTGFQPVEQATAKMAVSQAPADQKISIDDFAKVEMRVGEVIAAERIPKADKLLKLLVDIGTEVRQVCAGIAEYYEPEKLIGRKVVVVTNLAPRKLRGVESNGMIVAASVEPEGRPVLVTFQEDVPKGARLK